MPEHVLEARNIYKQFPGTLALNDVSVSFQAGAVHAVLGKNGSGKSTLMKIFSGAHLPTSGEIYLDGEKMQYTTTEMAIQSGIATVYQELSVIKDLTVAENLLIGRLPIFAPLTTLTEDQLVQLLTEPRNALVKQYTKLLAMSGVRLKVEKPALRAMAKQAIERGTGARALRGIFERLMLDVMYEAPGDKTIDTITITEDVVLGKSKPRIKRKSKA